MAKRDLIIKYIVKMVYDTLVVKDGQIKDQDTHNLITTH